jgi:hypothetical protein
LEVEIKIPPEKTLFEAAAKLAITLSTNGQHISPKPESAS